MGVASKGYGEVKGPGHGRGGFSQPKNPAPVPMKGSSLNMASPVGGRDREKVKKMAKEQMRQEDLRGMPS